MARKASRGLGRCASPRLVGSWLIAGAAVCAQAPGTAHAADWSLTPRVSLTEDFSDNIDLAPAGQRSSDFVTEISPGVSLRGRGARLSMDLDYAFQQLLYRQGNRGNSNHHQLQAGGNAELVQQTLFLEASATASQENISNRGRISTSNVSVTGNQNDVYTYSLIPLAKHHFGRYADAEVRTHFDSVINSNADDSTSSGMSAALTSGRQFNKLPWSLRYERQTINNESADDTRFESLQGTLDYVLNRKISLRFGMGREENDLASTGVGGSAGTPGGGNQQSGNIWTTSVIWRPTERSNFEVGYEDRFFDSNLFFNLAHRSRRTAWTASYSSELTTSRQLQLDRELFPLVDAFGEPILDPFTGEIVQVPVDTPTLSNQVFRRQRLNGSVTVQGRRTSTTLNVYDDRRDDPGSPNSRGTERVFGFSNSWSRTLSPRTRANANASWQRTTRDIDDTQDTFWSVGIGMGRTLGRNLSAQVDFQHVRSAPQAQQNRYTENRLSAGLKMDF